MVASRKPFKPRSTKEELYEMNQFTEQMRKYYPKNSRFFSDGSHYHPRCGDNFKNPNSLVPQRYKRDFFRSFYADLTKGVPEPSKIPQNLQTLKIFVGTEIVLKKMIKQNKGLKHLIIESKSHKINTEVIKHLKYLKGLRSIELKDFPLFSEAECKKMLRTWGKTLESFECHGEISKSDNKSFTRAMETILMFPKLKMFQFDWQSFLFEKLQARNIAYNVEFRISDFNSFIEKFPESRPVGNVIIPLDVPGGKSNKMSLEMWKFQKKSNQTLSLRYFWDRNAYFKTNPLSPVFRNISSLDLSMPGSPFKFKYSSLGQLNNLMHLSVEICDGREKEIFGDFFRYLNKNVTPHQKLETFLIKTYFGKDVEEEEEQEEKEEEEKSNAIVNFFEACSQNLKTVHFEFSSSNPKAEPFYKGLSKLENLQSLSLSLSFTGFEPKEHINKLCKVISGMKSLKELDFELFLWDCKEKQVNLTFPHQLKKLSVRMDTSLPSFNILKTLEPLTNLTHLELEFSDFSSPKWRKILSDIINSLKRLEVLVLKGIKEDEKEDRISQMKEKLDKIMKECSNLKLIVFAHMKSKEIIILKRNYSWSEINLIIADLSVEQDMKVDYIKSYNLDS